MGFLITGLIKTFFFGFIQGSQNQAGKATYTKFFPTVMLRSDKTIDFEFKDAFHNQKFLVNKFARGSARLALSTHFSTFATDHY